MSTCAACGATRPDPDFPSCQTCGADGDQLEDRTPMTRTELAMLWDLLGRWLESHPYRTTAVLLAEQGLALRHEIDNELAERFGG